MEKALTDPEGTLAIHTLAMPADTNPAGDIFGGWVMSQMGLAAVECAKATMVVRQGAYGRVLLEGDQVSIEKSVYLSLCRRHWEEATGRWPTH